MTEINSALPLATPQKKSSTGIWIIVSKIGLKLLSVLSKGTKVILAGASFAAYSYMFTWEFAAMLIIMIFIHEYGHYIAMKQCGIKTKGIYLIPFLGGAAIAEEDFKTRRDEAYIALMGPWFGFGISFLTGLLYYVTDNPLFAAGAVWMAMINLFNLLPINPLDGGRVLKSITFSLHSWVGLVCLFLGLGTLAFFAVLAKSVLFALLTLIAFLELAVEYKKSQKVKLGNIPEKPIMTKKQMIWYVFLYLFTCAMLFGLMEVTSHIPGAAAAMEILK